MITLKEFPNKIFDTSDDAMKELILNKKLIIAEKKLAVKYADALPYYGTIENDKKEIVKATNSANLKDATSIKVGTPDGIKAAKVPPRIIAAKN